MPLIHASYTRYFHSPSPPKQGVLMYIYISPRIDAFYNLALEEHMLRTRLSDNILLLWQSDNTVVIGRHQNIHQEVDSGFVQKNNINIVRRSTGGGAVYHDAGNLNFSFISDSKGSSDATMKFFTAPIITALRGLGLNVHLSGRNDILIDEVKISGNAQMLLGKRILHHGTLLFNSDLSVLSQALKVRPEKFRSKTTQSVRGRVGNIVDFLPEPLSMENFINHLVTCLTQEQSPKKLELEQDDIAVVESLREQKYTSWDWNYARSPKSDFRWMERFDGGFLEVYMTINKGRIAGCEFYGDYLAMRPSENIAACLLNLPFDQEAVRQALETHAQRQHPLNEYFGSITLDEVLHCMFTTGF